MAVTNFVSGQLSASDIDTIMKAIETIRKAMPFLRALTEEEKRGLPKFGDKSHVFVQKSCELAKTYGSDFLPAKFDVKEMVQDVELMNKLSIVMLAISKLEEEIQDTWSAVSTDAYTAALVVYQYAKNSNLGTVGLDGALDELGKRFARRTKAKDEEPKL